MDRFAKLNDSNSKVGKGATVKEVVKKKVPSDINVKNIDPDIYVYIQSTGIPISTFVRMALKEKMDRDS